MAPRASRRARWLPLGGLVLALAGCGHSQRLASPRFPLVPGAHVVKRVKVCDKGANPFCALDMVVVDPRYRGGLALAQSEQAHLKALGWAVQKGENEDEQTALSPGTKLRLTYGSASDELMAIDLNRVKRRPQSFALALAKTLFERTPAMAIILEAGPR